MDFISVQVERSLQINDPLCDVINHPIYYKQDVESTVFIIKKQYIQSFYLLHGAGKRVFSHQHFIASCASVCHHIYPAKIGLLLIMEAVKFCKKN